MKGEWCPYDEKVFCQEEDCKNCQIYYDTMDDCIPWDIKEVDDERTLLHRA